MCTALFPFAFDHCTLSIAFEHSGLGSLPAAAHAFRQQVQGENMSEAKTKDTRKHEKIRENTRRYWITPG